MPQKKLATERGAIHLVARTKNPNANGMCVITHMPDSRWVYYR